MLFGLQTLVLGERFGGKGSDANTIGNDLGVQIDGKLDLPCQANALDIAMYIFGDAKYRPQAFAASHKAPFLFNTSDARIKSEDGTQTYFSFTKDQIGLSSGGSTFSEDGNSIEFAHPNSVLCFYAKLLQHATSVNALDFVQMVLSRLLAVENSSPGCNLCFFDYGFGELVTDNFRASTAGWARASCSKNNDLVPTPPLAGLSDPWKFCRAT